MSKFQVKLNSGLPGVKASVGAGATVTATIDNTAGFGSFAWSVAGTDETTDWEAVTNSIVTSGARNETATFVVGGVGSAVRIQAVADGGVNQRTGAADPALVATAKAFVAAANGAEVITINETRESDAKWAYTALVNNAIRATYGGGPALSDADPQPLGTANPGVAGTAMRGDAVIAHGDLAGGTLHDAVTTEDNGFATPQILLDIADLTDAIAALPSTYSPIGHTHAQYTLLTDGAVPATANKWAIRDASGYVGAAGITHTDNVFIDALTASKSVWLRSANQAVVQTGGSTRLVIDGGGFAAYVNFVFASTVANPVLGYAAKSSGTGGALTISGQSVTTGTGGHVIIQAGTGSTKAGEVQLSGDAIRGLSNEFAWMSLDTYTKATLNSASGVTFTAKGIKLQVNDATAPATVRTPFEIVREAGGVGTADRVYVDGDFGVLRSGAWFNVQTATGRFTFDWTDDGNGMSAYWDHVNGFMFSGAPINLGSTATAGQFRTLDGEVLNAMGSTGAEVCLVSYDKTLTSAVFGSDGASARQTATSVLAGSTSAQLVVGSASQLEARADHVKANTQLSNGVNAVAASASTTTIDCSKGNVHKVTVSAATTIALSNTKAGAQYRIYFELSGSTARTVTLGATHFDDTYDRDLPAGTPLTLALTSSLTRAVVICEPHADTGKAFVTQMWTKP